MKIAVVGNGAIGNLVAANCKDQNVAYSLLTRTGQGFEISVSHIDNRIQLLKPEVIKVDSPEDFDILLLPLKAYQIAATLTQLLPYISSQHTIVLLHNGMGTIEKVRSLLPDNPIVAATTSCGAYKPDENTLIETGLGQTDWGWVSENKGENSVQIETLLSSLLRPSKWHLDIRFALWRKLAVNAVINPLTAIHQISNGQLSEGKYMPTIQQMCQETAQVMRACGNPCSKLELSENVLRVIHSTAANLSSMNRDIAFKRQTEIDFINGYIIAQGRRFDVETPYNNQLFSAIKKLESTYLT